MLHYLHSSPVIAPEASRSRLLGWRFTFYQKSHPRLQYRTNGTLSYARMIYPLHYWFYWWCSSIREANDIVLCRPFLTHNMSALLSLLHPSRPFCRIFALPPRYLPAYSPVCLNIIVIKPTSFPVLNCLPPGPEPHGCMIPKYPLPSTGPSRLRNLSIGAQITISDPHFL